MNSVWNNKELPQQWNESVIEPTYKKGDKTDCSNCTGISMLPTHNILSNIIPSGLTSYVYEVTMDH
jgi:hypothetical protein